MIDFEGVQKMLDLIKRHNAVIAAYAKIEAQYQAVPESLDSPEYKEHREEYGDMMDGARELCALCNDEIESFAKLRSSGLFCYGVTREGMVKEYGSEPNMVIYVQDENE